MLLRVAKFAERPVEEPRTRSMAPGTWETQDTYSVEESVAAIGSGWFTVTYNATTPRSFTGQYLIFARAVPNLTWASPFRMTVWSGFKDPSTSKLTGGHFVADRYSGLSGGAATGFWAAVYKSSNSGSDYTFWDNVVQTGAASGNESEVTSYPLIRSDVLFTGSELRFQSGLWDCTSSPALLEGLDQRVTTSNLPSSGAVYVGTMFNSTTNRGSGSSMKFRLRYDVQDVLP